MMDGEFVRAKAAFSEEACLAAVMVLRFGGTHVACPACGREGRFEPVVKRRAFSCPSCGHSLYPCLGTPFEKRDIDLATWFFAIGVKARGADVARELRSRAGVTREAAARMARALDDLAAQTRRQGPLAGWFERLADFATRGEARTSAASVPGGAPATGAAALASGPRAPPRPARRGRALVAGAVLAGVGVAGLGAATTIALVTRERTVDLAAVDVDLDAGAVVPDLIAPPPTPSFVLSAVEEDLAAARAAVAFAESGMAPEADDLPEPEIRDAPAPAAPARRRPPPALKPGVSKSDPNEVLVFGPMKIRRHLVETIVRASRVVGADPTLLMAIADKESSFATEVKAKTSSATGLYQFIEATWLGVVHDYGARHGLADEAKAIARSGRRFVVADAAERERILELRREPYLSALLAAEMLKRDTQRMEKRIGRHLTAGEIYLIHFLGPGAAEIFIDSLEGKPHTEAAELFPRPAEANRPIFYAQGEDGLKGLSVAEVHKKFESMMAVRLQRYRDVKRVQSAPPRPAPPRDASPTTR